LAVFGIVWMTVVWPSLAKVPTGFDQEVLQQGTVTVYDSAHDAYVTYDVINSRHYVAVAAKGDILYIDDIITFTDTSTSQEIPFLRAKYFLGIDRVTRTNLEGRGDGIAGGHYSFPFGVDKDEVYPFWNEGNPANLDNKYVGETDLEGLHVYIFNMSTPDEGLTIPAGFVPPDLAYQPAMRIDQNITLYVEPSSGATVYFEGTTKRSGTIPVPDPLYPATGPMTYKDVTFYEDNLTFTQGTIDDLVGQAKSAKTQVALAKNLLPWLSIGSGVVLIALGVFLALRKASQSAPPAGEKAGSGSQSG